MYFNKCSFSEPFIDQGTKMFTINFLYELFTFNIKMYLWILLYNTYRGQHTYPECILQAEDQEHGYTL